MQANFIAAILDISIHALLAESDHWRNNQSADD